MECHKEHNLSGMDFMCIVWLFLKLLLNLSSIRNDLFFLRACNRARILFNIDGLPLPIPSTRNHNFCLQGAFNMARIMLDIANLPLTTRSTGNHLFLVYGTKIMLAIAGLSFTILSIRNCFSLLQHIFNRARVLLGVGQPPSNFFIQH